MMSGTLVSTAHTLAHSQTLAAQVFVDSHDHVVDSSHETELKSDISQPHSEDSHDTNEHGAELHFTALDMVMPQIALVIPRGNLNASYLATHFPSPQLPPDPYPDRA